MRQLILNDYENNLPVDSKPDPRRADRLLRRGAVMDRIDTVADFLAWRESDPGDAWIVSKTRGRIPVPCLRVALVHLAGGREPVHPNEASPDKMDLLQTSILASGFCFPVVTVWDPEAERCRDRRRAPARRSSAPTGWTATTCPWWSCPDMRHRTAATGSSTRRAGSIR